MDSETAEFLKEKYASGEVYKGKSRARTTGPILLIDANTSMYLVTGVRLWMDGDIAEVLVIQPHFHKRGEHGMAFWVDIESVLEYPVQRVSPESCPLGRFEDGVPHWASLV